MTSIRRRVKHLESAQGSHQKPRADNGDPLGALGVHLGARPAQTHLEPSPYGSHGRIRVVDDPGVTIEALVIDLADRIEAAQTTETDRRAMAAMAAELPTDIDPVAFILATAQVLRDVCGHEGPVYEQTQAR